MNFSEKIETIAADVYANGICVFGNFIDANEVIQLLEAFELKRTQLKSAGIGKGDQFTKEESIRKDKIVWLEKNDNHLSELFFDKVNALVTGLNRRCFLGLNDYEFHFACYGPGAFYKRHKDTFSNDSERKISAIIYLNQNWKEGDGGELCIYSEQTLTVQPLAGTLVLFESHIEHEVLKSNTQRISITGWLKSVKNNLL